MVLGFKQTDKILYVRGLACATHGDIAHRDDWGTKGTALQDTHLEQQIPDAYAQAIEPG
jgi:hypothetical protein